MTQPTPTQRVERTVAHSNVIEVSGLAERCYKVALQLATELEAAQKEINSYKETLDNQRGHIAERLKDKERLDWLISRATKPAIHCGDFHYWGDSDTRTSLRTAIDSAMQPKEGK